MRLRGGYLARRRPKNGDRTMCACSSHVRMACVRGGARRRAPRNESPARPLHAAAAPSSIRLCASLAAAPAAPGAPAAAWAAAWRAAARHPCRQRAQSCHPVRRPKQKTPRGPPRGRRRRSAARAARPVRRCPRCRPARARAGPATHTRPGGKQNAGQHKAQACCEIHGGSLTTHMRLRTSCSRSLR